ncbi:MAG: hypothetical protein QF463_16245 [Vicinamibacterales bacterium]|jgi:KamA family protein|nr:hypothetical protein [Vicinamibacterales bacterium]MDP6610617.1 hypothetical protein [Vicinamibacterales bacterium]HAK54477.1 lysine 2,3-aminomutase [Acidobacteriota bacterium]|tara:strand:- start:76 stop:1512 length:1437 start_codon:yes stop_codon:yes gene_type:complete
MATPSHEPTGFQAIGLQNVAKAPQWAAVLRDVREGVEVVGNVLPFRTNRYVLEELIDWSRVPDDPIFQLVFPQRGMISDDEYDEVAALLRSEAPAERLAETVNRIRLGLNPHPAGQLTHNVPTVGDERLAGIQHKYRETVLFFPAQGQTCHAYCTYCFRWAQFVGLDGITFQAKETDQLVSYLKAHPEVSDVLVTGGDAMIMKSSVLRRYVEPLLAPGLEHVRNIRFGTKAVAYWPQRFVTDPDADDCLRLFEEIGAAGRHVAVMGHYSHPVELEPEIARQAIRRVRETGAQIRMQAPLIRRVNDDPRAWATLWETGVSLGLIPYYMFVERDTGARKYFEVPLLKAYEIFTQAYRSVSGLARSVRGPSMSAFPGKVRVLGVLTIRDLIDSHIYETLRRSVGFDLLGDPDQKMVLCDFIQARDPRRVKVPFLAELDDDAAWFDDLRPALGQKRFPFERDDDTDREQRHPLASLTELLLE